MKKILKAQKQKDTRTLKYDPDADSLSRDIQEFYAYKKTAKFYKSYSEMEIFSLFTKIKFMKTMDQKNKELVEEANKRQNKIRLKYNRYIEYSKWSESPLADKTKPLSMAKKVIIVSVFVVLIIAMLLIIVGLNKWW